MKTLFAWLPPRRRVTSRLRHALARSSNTTPSFEQLESRNLLAVDIVIVAGSGLSSNTDALAAFDRAAQAWETYLADNITITIDADLANLGNPNVIGQTGSVLLQAGYDTIRNQLVADAADEADDAIVSSLPTSATATFSLPSGFSLNGSVVGTKASLKAAGFTGLDTQFGTVDGTITFNSGFQFDYNNSDGVTANTMDFETVAIHEIGHALGFISQVDTVDYYSYVNSPTSVAPSTLDLFRFANGTSNDPSDAASFTSASRSLLPGVDAVTDDVTGAGNAAAENRMSTGAYTGDGRQASHFKDNLSIGVMDPTLAFGEVVAISDADLRALDLIGYEVSFGPVQNIAPVASNDSATIAKRSGVAVGNVLSNDTDANGDALTATLVDSPANGSLVFHADGSFTYTPSASFSGSDTFTYFASDGQDNSNIATVTIQGKGGGGSGGGGSGGGGKPGGGGGKPNRLEAFSVGFSAAALSHVGGDFSIHEPPVGMDGERPKSKVTNGTAIIHADIASVISLFDFSRLQAVDRVFNSTVHDEDSPTVAHDAADQRDPPLSYHQAAPAERALLALDAAAQRSEWDAIDQILAELSDTLTLPLSPEF